MAMVLSSARVASTSASEWDFARRRSEGRPNAINVRRETQTPRERVETGATDVVAGIHAERRTVGNDRGQRSTCSSTAW